MKVTFGGNSMHAHTNTPAVLREPVELIVLECRPVFPEENPVGGGNYNVHIPAFPQEPIEDEAHPRYVVETPTFPTEKDGGEGEPEDEARRPQCLAEIPSFPPEDLGAGTEARLGCVLFPVEKDGGEGETEDERAPRFQPEDGGSGGEGPVLCWHEDPGGAGEDVVAGLRPQFPPDDGGMGGRAPRFEPDENPVGGGSRRPVRPQEPIEDDFTPHLCGPDEPPLGGGRSISMRGPRWTFDPSGGGEGPVYVVPISGYQPEVLGISEERDGKGGKVRAISTYPALPQFGQV